MANNYGVANTVFKPFSFDEMLKPALMVTEAHNKLEEQISNLEVITNDLEHKITNDPKDKVLKEKYNLYKNQLKKASDLLSSKGLNSDIKKTFNNLRALYSQNFSGVDEAYKKLNERQKLLDKIAMEHPEMIVEHPQMALSDFMGGASPDFKTANTKDIYTNSFKSAAGLSNRIVNSLKPKGILGNQYYQFVTQKGVSQEMVDKLRGIIDNPTSEEALNYLNTDEGRALFDIVQEERRSANYDSFSKSGKDKIDASILNGIFSGAAYKEDIDRVANKNWKTTPNTPPTPPESPVISSLNTITLGNTSDKNLSKQAEKERDSFSKFKFIKNEDGSTSVKTDEIINLENEISKVLAEITEIDDKTDPFSKRNYGAQKRNVKTLELAKLQKQLEKATEETTKSYSEIDDKYSYLGFDSSTNISKGIQYADARSKEEVFIGDLQYRPEDEKKLDTSVTKDLKGISGGNVGLFNPGESKALSTKDANSLLEDAHVVVNSKEGIVLKTSDGIKNIKGIDTVDAFNASYKATSNFLKDYTKEGLKNVNTIQGSIEDINNITVNDIPSLVNNGLVTVVSNAGGDTFYGMIVKDSSTDNIYKVLLHPSGYKAVSSLNEIINFGGPSIRKYEETMLNRGLEHYFDINTRKP